MFSRISAELFTSGPSLEETGWEGLPELVGLLLVVDDESVEVATAAHLELDAVLVLLYLHRFGIGSPGSQEEILDLHDLLRHFQASCCRIFKYKQCEPMPNR